MTPVRDRATDVPKPGYRIVPHTAEVAMDIRGRGWPEFYRNAALGLKAVYAAQGRPAERRKVRCVIAGGSAEETLVAWLNELIYRVSVKRWFPAAVRIVHADARRAEAELRGGAMGAGPNRRVRVVGEVKSATFSDLVVRRISGCWSARVVLDV